MYFNEKSIFRLDGNIEYWKTDLHLSILVKLLDQFSEEVEPRSYIFLVSQTLVYKLEKLDFEKIILKFPWELHPRLYDTSERTVPQMTFVVYPHFHTFCPL